MRLWALIAGLLIALVVGVRGLVAEPPAEPSEPLPFESDVRQPDPDPVRVGDRSVQVIHHRDDYCTILQATDPDGTRPLVTEGCPDRPALSADGLVAYVSGVTGIASVFVIPFDGGDAVQLTNVGLEHAPITVGSPPEGFVPPPHAGPPWFDGDRLVWEAEDGRHEVPLP